MCTHGWGLKPLEVILSVYLDMIEEGKVATTRHFTPTWEGSPESISSWIMRSYTKADVEKAISVMQRLVAALKSRQPVHPCASLNPWTDFESTSAHIS
jgi:hypothetical protein